LLVSLVGLTLAYEEYGCDHHGCYHRKPKPYHCQIGHPFKKCISTNQYVACDGLSCNYPTLTTCLIGTYCACDGFCNATLFPNPCQPLVPPVGGGGDLPAWPTGPFTTVFIGNDTRVITGITTVNTLIPSAQLWADGTGKYFAKWFQTVNGVAQSQFKLLYPAAPLSCEFSGDEIPRSCSLNTAGQLQDFKLGLVIPANTVLVSQTFNSLGEVISTYSATNPPVTETWTYNENTETFLNYKRQEVGSGFVDEEIIDFLWVVKTPVNPILFNKPTFCTANCP
jgi:hypothetical protein